MHICSNTLEESNDMINLKPVKQTHSGRKKESRINRNQENQQIKHPKLQKI